MLDLFKDLWGFARDRKKYWLVPLVGTLVLLSVLLALAQFSAVAPFIYTLF
ncbi:MAG TPA: DUF5989 family protein [Candidatus Binataceae bacterium]|jgi:hypothetical protein|nr:DUF5989 family protein [Candidatus Binataceae bacterium]